MPRLTFLLPLALATLSATALTAQSPDPAGQPQPIDNQPAPIQRNGPAMRPGNDNYSSYSASLTAGQAIATTRGIANAQPATGVYVRVAPNSSIREVSADAQRVEFRVERGLVNISVHHPDEHELILVDLPGGQVQLLKNGFYTFNAAQNAVRVLRGEADAFPLADSNAKPLKVKEYHSVIFPAAGQTGIKLRSIEFYPMAARADIISTPSEYARASDGPAYGYGYPAYGFGGYGYGYPWGYGPYGDGYYGYPFGWGLGFGPFYGGGFYGGGFYGGGFRGRR